jgi:ubiquinone/menaquinone biosynthesis C-methylase UbiE
MNSAYIRKQVQLLRPYIKPKTHLLDFGCGDLSLANALKQAVPGLTATGIDVVDSGARYPGISFRTYNGKTLPYKEKTFDITTVYHVLHHCDDPEAALGEVMRVTKKIILLVEPVYRNSLDIFFMKILDRLGNGWRNVTIAMPFTFQKEGTWKKWVQGPDWKIKDIKPAGVLPGWLPFGETKLFLLTRAS